MECTIRVTTRDGEIIESVNGFSGFHIQYKIIPDKPQKTEKEIITKKINKYNKIIGDYRNTDLKCISDINKM